MAAPHYSFLLRCVHVLACQIMPLRPPLPPFGNVRPAVRAAAICQSSCCWERWQRWRISWAGRPLLLLLRKLRTRSLLLHHRCRRKFCGCGSSDGGGTSAECYCHFHQICKKKGSFKVYTGVIPVPAPLGTLRESCCYYLWRWAKNRLEVFQKVLR